MSVSVICLYHALLIWRVHWEGLDKRGAVRMVIGSVGKQRVGFGVWEQLVWEMCGVAWWENANTNGW
jgi:hypothetical protein